MKMQRIILAVDDDRAFLESLREILEDEGYAVKTLSEPLKVEEFIDKYKPNLLIIDVFMPARSGFNIIEDFNEKNVYQDIPKIFLTCLDDDIEKMTAKARGVVEYLVKPFEPKDLVKIVNGILK